MGKRARLLRKLERRKPITFLDCYGGILFSIGVFVVGLIWAEIVYPAISLKNIYLEQDEKSPFLAETIPAGKPLPVNSTGNRTRYRYDGLNRLVKIEREITSDGNGGSEVIKTITTRLEYDKNSRLIAQIDDNGNRTEYRYDALNRRTQTISPDGSSSFVTYDPNDNIIVYRDENGTTINCTYDAVNRLTDCSISRASGIEGTTSIHYDYDGLYRVIRVTDNNDPLDYSDDVTIEYAYDSLSRLLERVERVSDGSQPTIFSYDWKGDSWRTGITYPNDRKLTYQFDALDRITDIEEIADYQYIGAYRVKERSFPNGVTLTPQYDAGRRVEEFIHRQNQDIIADFCYTYNRTNNRLSEIRKHDKDQRGFERGERYKYDSLYRLINFEEGSFDANGNFLADTQTKSEDWDLDGAGNWINFGLVNNLNQYTIFDGNPLVYDRNKNLIEDARFRYTYDAFNRLRRVIRKSDNREVARYIYSAEGNMHMSGSGKRIKKITPQGIERYCWDGDRISEVRDGSGRVTKQFIYGAQGEPIRMDVYNSVGTAIERKYSYLENSIGSIVALTDERGNVVERYTYDPYGKPEFRNPDNTLKQPPQIDLGNPLLFAGGWYDPETGFYYNQHRYYDPKLGRFLSKDPVDIWGDIFNLGNPYTYVGNNPINRSDPFGLFSTYNHKFLTKFGITEAIMDSHILRDIPDAQSTMIIDVITKANIDQDDIFGSVAALFGGGRLHEHYNRPPNGNKDIWRGKFSDFVRDEYKNALRLADERKCKESLESFGRVLHARQDFYGHAVPTFSKIFAQAIVPEIKITPRQETYWILLGAPTPDSPWGTYPSDYGLGAAELAEHLPLVEPIDENWGEFTRRFSLADIDTKRKSREFLEYWWSKCCGNGR